ncbi:type II toxin-antitoxin system HicB family antitoxin [Pseudogulbenkiania sp. MAI-1]|uniref:type II toxin-antitoxin system HicB family antitoxin n=1 Tax=Pseudogulbenkiania sp. MAI-1 TaxID=990370 RepID=UPI000A04BA59|nr:type II toxin-antitoxin system HicB family antitoxin [Pseudogulbenkiania sp. MAI-1]
MSDLLEYKGFFGSVGYSAEDACLTGEVLFIDGTIVYGGESVDEIKAMFEEAVDGYLEMCAARNIEPQKPFKGTFNVRIDPELHKQAAIAAKRECISLNQFVGLALKEKLSPAKEVHNHSHMHVHEETVFETRRQYIASRSGARYVSNEIEKSPWIIPSHH